MERLSLFSFRYVPCIPLKTFNSNLCVVFNNPKKAFDKAIKNSNKVVMSLSDLFCVERHKNNCLELVKNQLDIISSKLCLIHTN